MNAPQPALHILNEPPLEQVVQGINNPAKVHTQRQINNFTAYALTRLSGMINGLRLQVEQDRDVHNAAVNQLKDQIQNLSAQQQQNCNINIQREINRLQAQLQIIIAANNAKLRLDNLPLIQRVARNEGAAAQMGLKLAACNQGLQDANTAHNALQIRVQNNERVMGQLQAQPANPLPAQNLEARLKALEDANAGQRQAAVQMQPRVENIQQNEKKRVDNDNVQKKENDVHEQKQKSDKEARQLQQKRDDAILAIRARLYSDKESAKSLAGWCLAGASLAASLPIGALASHWTLLMTANLVEKLKVCRWVISAGTPAGCLTTVAARKFFNLGYLERVEKILNKHVDAGKDPHTALELALVEAKGKK